MSLYTVPEHHTSHLLVQEFTRAVFPRLGELSPDRLARMIASFAKVGTWCSHSVHTCVHTPPRETV